MVDIKLIRVKVTIVRQMNKSMIMHGEKVSHFVPHKSQSVTIVLILMKRYLDMRTEAQQRPLA